MLTKRVCKKCIIRNCQGSSTWTANDEKNWEAGFVICSFQFMKQRLYLGNDPPEECPFILEHLVYKEEKTNA